MLKQVIFAPDQSAIYFGSRPMPTGPNPHETPLEIHRVPFIGGTPKTLASGVWLGTMALSPDGRQMIFTCGWCDGCLGRTLRMVQASGSGTVEDLFTYDGIIGRCLFADDGKSILCPSARKQVDGALKGNESLRFDLATRKLDALPQLEGISVAAPVRNAGGMLVAGKLDPGDRHDQLWWLGRDTPPVRLREDLLDFGDVSASSSGDVVTGATKLTRTPPSVATCAWPWSKTRPSASAPRTSSADSAAA